MKRVIVGMAVVGAAAVLGGCPIYPSNTDYRVCGVYDGATDSCYDCPDTSYSGSCVPWQCSADTDCGSGYTCTSNNTCAAGGGADDGGSPNGQACTNPSQCSSQSTCAADGTCHTGDCISNNNGCVSGYVCKLSGGIASCVAISPPPGDDSGSDDSGGDAATDSSGDDSGDGGNKVVVCNLDSDCSNAKCVDGLCTVAANLCSDGTECRVGGSACVEGRCTQPCSQANPGCATGWSCNFLLNVCNINPMTCATTADCQGGSVCVEAHCAAPCTVSDGGALSCATGQVCVNGGCIPDEQAVFSCTNDGVEGPPANACAAGSLCLHHDCYVDCAGGDGGAGCGSNQVCKQVTIVKGTFSVCGTATDLGSDCDPQTGLSCASAKTCVDGYCK
jgi:hypothetical protein